MTCLNDNNNININNNNNDIQKVQLSELVSLLGLFSGIWVTQTQLHHQGTHPRQADMSKKLHLCNSLNNWKTAPHTMNIHSEYCCWYSLEEGPYESCIFMSFLILISFVSFLKPWRVDWQEPEPCQFKVHIVSRLKGTQDSLFCRQFKWSWSVNGDLGYTQIYIQ